MATGFSGGLIILHTIKKAPEGAFYNTHSF